jgi:hypothetical protein
MSLLLLLLLPKPSLLLLLPRLTLSRALPNIGLGSLLPEVVGSFLAPPQPLFDTPAAAAHLSS